MAQLVWRCLASADRLPVVVRIPAGPLGSLKCDPPKGNGRRPKKKKIRSPCLDPRCWLRFPIHFATAIQICHVFLQLHFLHPQFNSMGSIVAVRVRVGVEKEVFVAKSLKLCLPITVVNDGLFVPLVDERSGFQ